MDFFLERGMGVINACALGMALLTKVCPQWHPAQKSLKAACKEAAEYCEEKGYSLRTY